MSKLDAIFAHKRLEVAACRAQRPLAQVIAEAEATAPPLDFIAALRRAAARPALIAEVKQASPSRGLLLADFDPTRLAATYATNGATAISVLTDQRFFMGGLDHLRAVRAHAPGLPLLRKDFTCDPYQLYEARAAGADAVLLIVAALPAQELAELHALAGSLGLAALVEVHTSNELASALALGATLIGINNRNLHDFTVSLVTTRELARCVPPKVCLVAESGIFTAADALQLAQVERVGGGRGVEAILVGEALVTAPDVGAKVRELSGRGA